MASIRWMIRRDMPDVLRIEARSFEHNWTEDDYLRFLRQRNAIGMIAEGDDSIAGFMVYELHRRCIVLHRMAVDPRHRRRGVGTKMIEKLAGKLHPAKRNSLVLRVRETNAQAVAFCSARGMMAWPERGWFEDTGEDAYRFSLVVAAPPTFDPPPFERIRSRFEP